MVTPKSPKWAEPSASSLSWDDPPAQPPPAKPQTIFTFRKMVIEEVPLEQGDGGKTLGMMLDLLIAERLARGEKLVSVTLDFPEDLDR